MTFDEIESERSVFERRYEKRLERVLLSQGEDLAHLIEEEDFPLSAFLDTSEIERAITELWTVVIVRFADLSSQEVSMKADPPDRWLQIVTKFIARESGKLIKSINDTTLKLVQTIVKDGVVSGIGVREISRNLRKQWPDISRVRGERISRTEVVRASNYGSLSGAQETALIAGLDLEKIWLATPDERTRETHSAADGQRRKLHEPFIVGGYQAMYPGDSSLPAEESIQCRCIVTYEVAESKSWRDLRDARIKEQYPILKAQWGQIQALDELAEKESLSARQVKRIIYQGTRA